MYYFDIFFFFKQKPAYEVRISDWSSDVCSSDLLRPAILNVHASGGRAMMAAAAEAARETAEEHGIARPRVVGVTVLTSLDAGDRKSVGEGKRVSVRVAHGGRRIIKKQNNTQITKHTTIL